MEEDDVDLEDLESRLYSEVYHSRSEDVEPANSIHIEIQQPDTGCTYNYVLPNRRRYYQEHLLHRAPVAAHGTPNKQQTPNFPTMQTSTPVQNSFFIPPGVTPDFPNPANNFFYIDTAQDYSNEPLHTPNRKERKRLANKEKLLKKREQKRVEKAKRKQQAREQRLQQKEQNQQNSKHIRFPDLNPNRQVIFLDNSDDDDCVIVNNTKDMKIVPKQIKAEDLLSDNDEEAVIFVEPPPVQVIDLDPEPEDLQKTPEKPKAVEAPSNQTSDPLLQTPESTASNDFLESSQIDTNQVRFNFSLHGTDFHSQEDNFVRPQVPQTDNETESSCSTTEMNKDFNSSLRTAVFNEVDFPKEDMFSESNLETFGNYITPKRATRSTTSEPHCDSPIAVSLNQFSPNSSSEESEYSNAGNVSKVLPELSPMITYQTPKKPAKADVQSLSDGEVKKSKKKQKLKTKALSEDERETENSLKSKRKKRLSTDNPPELEETEHAEEADTSTVANKSKKKKRKSISEDKVQEEQENAAEPQQDIVEDSDSCHSSKKSGKRSKAVSEDEQEDGKSRRKKRQSSENTAELEEADNEDPTKGKKKKRKSFSEDKNLDESTVNEEVAETGETPAKNKKKKRKGQDLQTEASEPESVPDIPPDTETDTGSLKKKKKRLSSENKTTDNESTAPEMTEVVSVKEAPSTSEVAPQVPLQVPKDEQPSTSKSFVEVTNLDSDSDIELIPDQTELIVLDEVDSDSVISISELPYFSESDHDDHIDASLGQDLSLANCSSSFLDRSNISTSSDLPVNRSTFSERWHPDQSIFYGTIYDNNFEVDAIQATMKDDPNCWKILPSDRFPMSRPRGPKCHNCSEFGHFAGHCPNAKEVQCSLCGFSGHFEPRCPNRVCTQCGNAGSYSTNYCWKCVRFMTVQCNICRMFGHIADKCPDLWRRYHQTTEPGPLVVPPFRGVKPKDSLWCSGCSQRGHLEQNCGYLNRTYPPSDILVHKYEDVYTPPQHSRNITMGPQLAQGPTNIIIQLPQQTAIASSTVNIPNYNFQAQVPQQLYSGEPLVYQESSTKPPEEPSGTFKPTVPFLRQFKSATFKEIRRTMRIEMKCMLRHNQPGQAAKILRKLRVVDNMGVPKNEKQSGLYQSYCKEINSFLFGYHRFLDGKFHWDKLNQSLSATKAKLTEEKRSDLFNSFSYIFGASKKPGINYKKFVQMLMLREMRGKRR